MVGPWDIMLEFAGRMRELFAQQFGKRGLTISAGLALLKPKRPIKAAVAEAERLLEDAKTRNAPLESAPKDQLAAFGQLWKWQRHDTILNRAKQLATGSMRGRWNEAGCTPFLSSPRNGTAITPICWRHLGSPIMWIAITNDEPTRDIGPNPLCSVSMIWLILRYVT